jgi:prepilin-type N-terminal cleavage/methylation domain-containing protein
MRKKKGFTLIELLVVIAIIAMLLAILMPALSKVKRLAMRLVCGTNTKGMGTAMNVYAFDYDDEFPKQGGKGDNSWAAPALFKTDSWAIIDEDWKANDNVSVASSLYLLVREADVSPKSFVCPAAKEDEFKISDFLGTGPDTVVVGTELTDIWDFGPEPTLYCSYSYQQPYQDGSTSPSFAPTGTGNASKAILGDRNPWCDKELTGVGYEDPSDDYKSQVSKITWQNASSHKFVQRGNSGAHDREGQNILYNDGHSEFARHADVGHNNDNVYTQRVDADAIENKWRTGRDMRPIETWGYSFNRNDSVLVNDDKCIQ